MKKTLLIIHLCLLSSVFCFAQTRPNIVLILLDDSRFDSYTPNGGPSFFVDTSITRIASEGINFPNMYCVYSLCVPSRASILTGVYPHTSGALNNGYSPNPDLPELQEILHDNGYRTGFIGKYDWTSDPQPGWGYWYASIGEDYTNGQFNYNGNVRYYFGHKTDLITDSAVAYISRSKTDSPFFLMVSHLAPHTPFSPERQDENLYDSIPMPIPANFYFFANNYPSFLRDSHFLMTDTIDVDTTLRGYYRMLAGVERSVERILGKLTSKGYLNNTMVIFTSDNGHLWGEHQLQVKRLAYEESSKVPLFIRYPAWFPTTGVVNNEFALNVDLAPTILDAAGINTDTFHFAGVSVKKLYDGTVHRSTFYYEVLSNETVAAMRQVRDKNYAYTYYYCDQLLEEFFDLTKDPHENQNQILNSNYQGLIQQYRNRLDSFKLVLNDTVTNEIKSCHLEDTVYLGDNSLQSFSAFSLHCFQLSNQLYVQMVSPVPAVADIMITDVLGRIIYADKNVGINNEKYLSLNVTDLATGTYVVVVKGNNFVRSSKVMITH